MTKILGIIIFILGFAGNIYGGDNDRSAIVFEAGENGYTLFRIPALCMTSQGTLFAICEARKRKGKDDDPVDLILKRSTDEGKTWSGIEMIYKDKRKTIGNPVVFEDVGSHRLHLIFSSNNKRIFHIHSNDEAKTWSAPRNIGSFIKEKARWRWIAPGPGGGIQLKNGKQKGRFVIPCNYRDDKNHITRAFSLYSDDGGIGWRKSNELPAGTNEVQLTELHNGNLLISARMQKNRKLTKGYRGLAISKDGGATWGKLFYSENLPCPLCHGSIITLSGGVLVQSLPYYTDVAEVKAPDSKLSRNDLSLWISLDEGKSWKRKFQVHRGASAYSCMAVMKKGEIGVLYEGGEQDCYQSIIFKKVLTLELVR